MIAKLEWTQNNAQHRTITKSLNGKQSPTNQQQQNQRHRTESSLTVGLKCPAATSFGVKLNVFFQCIEQQMSIGYMYIMYVVCI